VAIRETKIKPKEVFDWLETNVLTQEQHIRLLGILNQSLNAFPIAEVVQNTTDGIVLVNGRQLNLDETLKFRQGISALRDNWAFQLFGDQVLYNAIKYGVHFGKDQESIVFSRCAIWFVTQFKEYITKFDFNN